MPIVFKNGHWVSERSSQEELGLLERDFGNLSPAEREAATLILQGLSDPRGGAALLRTIGQLEWKRTPVDMQTFVMDPYYLGHTCDNLYPKLLKDLEELITNEYSEAVLTGAIGWGKTFMASIGICRLLYELSCMTDPHKSFGIASGSNISVVCLSVNEILARKVAYENIATKIEASPYFQESFPFEQTKNELRFPAHIWVAARASNDGSVLGLNVIGGLLDETNFMPRAQSNSDPRFNMKDRAEVLYNAIQRRMKSRFKRKGKMPGLMFVVSSKQTNDDFTAKRIAKAREDPTVFVRDYALWDVQPEMYADGDWFHVVVGNENRPSRILTEDEDVDEVRASLPDDCVAVAVPDDFRTDFDEDLEEAIRDLAGVATVAVSPYIQQRSKIIEAVNPNRVHPFSVEVYDPSMPGQFYWHKMVAFAEDAEGGRRPIIHPYAPRHIHIDPSLRGDATGFAMGHVAGWVNVVRKDDEGNKYPEQSPDIEIDFLLRIVPPVGGEIILADVRKLVYQLSRHGYMITCVSFDSWNSADAIQKLTQRGFNAIQVSVDKTMVPYDLLKSALYDGRLHYYRYPTLLKELRQLEFDRIKRKVDHPALGSKDVADAVAGVVFTLNEHAARMPLQFIRSSPQHADVWMQEHHQAVLARTHGSMDAPDLVDDNPGMLPPFLVGSGEPTDDGWWS